MKKHSEFQTGEVYQTSPDTRPKPRNGLITLLLVLVILFGGMASLLGILNIRLLRSGKPPEGPALSFSPPEATPPTTRALEEVSSLPLSGVGIMMETVTEFLQSYYLLPQGVYITDVEEGSAAQAAGCLPGDIIVEVNGRAVTEAEDAAALLEDCAAGETVSLTLYRAGKTHSVVLTLE